MHCPRCNAERVLDLGNDNLGCGACGFTWRQEYLASVPKDVKVLDLTRYLDQVKNRIRRIGVELEGGWTEARTDVVHDGSVQRLKAPEGKVLANAGEIASPTLLPIEAPAWMRRSYPQAINATCGMHVHLSFCKADLSRRPHNQYYHLLMVPEYPVTMAAYLYEWAKREGLPAGNSIWDRLEGKYWTCSKNFWPDDQARFRKDHDRSKWGNRYTAVNYCYSVFNGTLEVRLLPMFDDVEQAIRAVDEVVRITNACLVALKGNLRAKVKVEVNIDSTDEIMEHSLIEIPVSTSYEVKTL